MVLFDPLYIADLALEHAKNLDFTPDTPQFKGAVLRQIVRLSDNPDDRLSACEAVVEKGVDIHLETAQRIVRRHVALENLPLRSTSSPEKRLRQLQRQRKDAQARQESRLRRSRQYGSPVQPVRHEHTDRSKHGDD